MRPHIDEPDEVECWVRNLVHLSQLLRHTHKQHSYPDFMAKPNKGRLFFDE